METYVTSYSGAENATKTAMTQQKLNACIKSLNDLVDTFEPLVTEQDYGELDIVDQTYYQGYTKKLEMPPDGETPILAQIGNQLLSVGVIDSNGVFTVTRPSLSSSTINRFRFGDVNTTLYIGSDVRGPIDQPPPDIDDYKPHNTDIITGTTPVNEVITDANGSVTTITGTLTNHRATIFAEVTLMSHNYGMTYADWYWQAIQQDVTYSTGLVTVEVDLSKYQMNIHRRYRRRK